jgi:hypothetical protein
MDWVTVAKEEDPQGQVRVRSSGQERLQRWLNLISPLEKFLQAVEEERSVEVVAVLSSPFAFGCS